MADYKLEKVQDLEGDDKGKTHFILKLTVNGAEYAQNVMFPTDNPEKAAQEYADDYEAAIIERDKKLEAERKAQEEAQAKADEAPAE